MDAPRVRWLNVWRKSLMTITQECCKLYGTSHRGNTSKKQLYGYLTPITKIIEIRQTRHAGHCGRNKDELIRDVPPWTPSHIPAKIRWQTRIYLQQVCADTWCSLEDLPGMMGRRDKWWERVRDISASSTLWWWWCISFQKAQYFIYK